MQHKPKSPSYIKHSLVKASRKAFQRNHFFIFLTNIFGADVAKELADLYLIGTSKYWPGATVFWQVDCENRVRTGKVMLYDLQTGKRVKEPCSRIHWAHCLVNDPHFRLSQCLFGEHLLREYPGKPVVIVESEKSALIASAYYHEYVWLASGGISQLNMEKCLSLKGRNITLIPDADAFLAWQEKARILEKDLEQRVKVSRALEDIATETERGEGWDIADFLLKKKLKGLLNI
ncbi:DUF6371 domain-containing protein [Rufibacter glacialis]|nr:DUF6371 domain-containing protein [Rufibacter glacialis]